MLAARAGRIAQSPTMKVAAEAMKLKAAGRRRRRFRRRRAGLSDAGAHQRRRARRDRRQLHEVHDQLRHRGAEAGDRRALPRRTTASTTPRPTVIVTGRRQAGALQRRAGAVRAGDEVITHIARLADAGRADQARRRHAGRSCRRTPTKASASRAAPFIAAFTAAHARRRHQLARAIRPGALMPEAELRDPRGRSRAPRHLDRRSISATRS